MKPKSAMIFAGLFLLAAGFLFTSRGFGEDKAKNEYDTASGTFVVHEWGVVTHGLDDGDKAPNFLKSNPTLTDLPRPFPAPTEEELRVEHWQREDKPVIHFYTDKARKIDCELKLSDCAPLRWWPTAEYSSSVESEIRALEAWILDYSRNYLAGFENNDAKENKNSDSDSSDPRIIYKTVTKDGKTYLQIPPQDLERNYYDALERLNQLRSRVNENKTPNSLMWKNMELGGNLGVYPEVEKNHWIEKARKIPSVNVKAGREEERFIFWECVQTAPSPLSLKFDGEEFLVKNLGDHVALDVIFLVVEQDKASMKILNELPGGKNARAEAVKIELKNKGEFATQSERELRRVLEAGGLYASEAEQVAAIWRRDFFEKPGARVIYRWHQNKYDEKFPIRLSEKPDEIKRVMLEIQEIAIPSKQR